MSAAPRHALLAGAFAAAAFAVYAPALHGPFLSDDRLYLVDNAYVREAAPGHLRAMLDPRSDLTLMVANYAPVHLLAHAAEWRAFGEATVGYHALGVALHALAAALLVRLFEVCGVARGPALLGGAFFLLHPANVEAVAWISQRKTQLALVFALAALLLRRARPGLAAGALALGLLSKPAAAVAWPVAWALDRAGPGRAETGGAPGRAYLVVWGGLCAAYALVEWLAFRHANPGVAPLSPEPAVRLWTSAAIGMRYLAMAASSRGVSAFHEPEPVASPLDPWVLGALCAAGLLGGRAALTLHRRRAEAAFWLWAAASFAPVSQLFPFLFPMADRYLYFILPGLIGGVLLAAGDLGAPARRRAAAPLAALAAAAVLALFAARSFERAALWTSEGRLLADAVRHYPQGSVAHYVRAREAAWRGDAEAAVAALAVATARGHRDLEHLLGDPALAGLQGDPRFQALLRELAGRRIAGMAAFARLTEANRLKLATAHLVRGEAERAVEVLEPALAAGGAYRAEVRRSLARARAQLAAGAPPP